MFFEIPEYHDEGRLPKNTEQINGELGPFAGIFASPFLAGFTRPGQIYEQGLPGTLAALVVVDTTDGAKLPPSYDRLALLGGLNCVWLYVDPPRRDQSYGDYREKLHWSVRVTHPAGSSACDRSAKTSEPLEVTPVTNRRFNVDSVYLGVARFDTDTQGNPIFSFRCLNAWCEIDVSTEGNVRTPDGLHRPVPSVAQWDQKSADARVGVREVIKGWHDEQYLAYRDNDLKWKYTDVKALIKPNPGAATLDSVDYENQWQTVATIEVPRITSASKYYSWGLRTGDNQLQYSFNLKSKQWEARVITARRDTTAWFIRRTLHYDVSVPPTARFRWTLADDGVWAPCGNACCYASAFY